MKIVCRLNVSGALAEQKWSKKIVGSFCSDVVSPCNGCTTMTSSLVIELMKVKRVTAGYIFGYYIFWKCILIFSAYVCIEDGQMCECGSVYYRATAIFVFSPYIIHRFWAWSSPRAGWGGVLSCMSTFSWTLMHPQPF